MATRNSAGLRGGRYVKSASLAALAYDEWLVSRRYLQESLALVLEDEGEGEEVRALEAA